jgi:hypothetical protein
MDIKKQRMAGKIAVIVVFFILASAYLAINSSVSARALSSVQWPNLLLLMFLYAVIPGVPVVLLRLLLGVRLNWLAWVAGIVGALCFLAIALGVRALPEDYEWFVAFLDYTLISSVPALFCAVFLGGKEVWLAVVPSLLYFLGFFAHYALMYGFSIVVDLLRYFDVMFIFYQDPDPYILASMVTLILMSAVFVAWALFCIFASHVIFKFSTKEKTKTRHKKSVNKF